MAGGRLAHVAGRACLHRGRGGTGSVHPPSDQRSVPRTATPLERPADRPKEISPRAPSARRELLRRAVGREALHAERVEQGAGVRALAPVRGHSEPDHTGCRPRRCAPRLQGAAMDPVEGHARGGSARASADSCPPTARCAASRWARLGFTARGSSKLRSNPVATPCGRDARLIK
jgi:hypothetical protein